MINQPTVIELISDAEKKLVESDIDTARLDAEVLLAFAMGKKRGELYLDRNKIPSTTELKKFHSYIEERIRRCPVAYITGEKEFWSIPIKVTQECLIPRPESELIVESVLKIYTDKTRSFEILDLCTGSGCVAMALATEFPNTQITCTDISATALEIAKINLNHVKNPSQFYCGDLFDALKEPKTFHLITANPPYVPTGHQKMLDPEITAYEPAVSLYGGKSGLNFMAKIIEHASLYLKTEAWLVMEMGLGQAEKMEQIAAECGGYDKTIIARDLQEIERVICLRRSKNG